MTRKDFVLIAEIIRESPVNEKTREMLAIDFARALKKTNARFDFHRFVSACQTK